MTLSEPGLQVLNRMKTHKHYLRRRAKNDAQNVSYQIEEDTESNEDSNQINGNSTDAGMYDKKSQEELMNQLYNLNNKHSSEYKTLFKKLSDDSKNKLRTLNLNRRFKSQRYESKQKYAEVKDNMVQADDLDEEEWRLVKD